MPVTLNLKADCTNYVVRLKAVLTWWPNYSDCIIIPAIVVIPPRWLRKSSIICV